MNVDENPTALISERFDDERRETIARALEISGLTGKVQVLSYADIEVEGFEPGGREFVVIDTGGYKDKGVRQVAAFRSGAKDFITLDNDPGQLASRFSEVKLTE